MRYAAVFLLLFLLSALFLFRGALLSLLPFAPDTAERTQELRRVRGADISVFATVPGARVIVQDGRGNFWVSQTAEGSVSRIEVSPDGEAVSVTPVFTGLDRPHGLAIDPEDSLALYVAQTGEIWKTRPYEEGGEQEKIADLPGGGRHFTRTIGFGPDGRLYVSVGSSCDACEEEDGRRAAILSMEKDGSDVRRHASGLRNAVFFAWSEVDGRMWATEMGRDFLGDDLPPDEVNSIEEGGFYGWPFCYGKNVRDTGVAAQDAVSCGIPSAIDIPAHSAPLGLAFVPKEGWPEEYWHDLLVAYHGSWNRTEPTGYKIVRMELTPEGEWLGTTDFIAGWLTSNTRVLGRPVDILVQPGGIAYVTDDKAGVVYRITIGEEVQLPVRFDTIQKDK